MGSEPVKQPQQHPDGRPYNMGVSYKTFDCPHCKALKTIARIRAELSSGYAKKSASKLSIENVLPPQSETRNGVAGTVLRVRVLPQKRDVDLFWSSHNNQSRQSLRPGNCSVTDAVILKALNRANEAGELDFSADVSWIDIRDSDFD
jgi:hypothetical protein